LTIKSPLIVEFPLYDNKLTEILLLESIIILLPAINLLLFTKLLVFVADNEIVVNNCASLAT
jgi:hypothetical protein